MSEYMKCIDPKQRWTWQHPEYPETSFEYKALAGPLLSRDIGARYLNACITRATNVDIPGIGPVSLWDAVTGPAVEWAAILPADVSNALFLAIAGVSQLSADESRDSRSPSGAAPSPTSTDATDAGGSSGSVPDGRTTPQKAGSGSAPRRKAGSR